MSEDFRSAVYYPHTGIRTVALLKSSLLFWDHVEFIAPSKDFAPRPPIDAVPGDKTVQEAMELVLTPHVPTPEEQTLAHETISALAQSDLGEYLREEAVDDDPYLIYPEKFLDRTWSLLRRSKLAHAVEANPYGDYATPPVLGLVMMSVLADACAGTRKRTITDQNAAYMTVRDTIIRNVIGGFLPSPRDELLDITLKIASIDDLPLKKLLELRKREEKSADQSLKNLRRALVKRIDNTAAEMAKHPRMTDRAELQRQFEEEMEGDFNSLRAEMGDIGWKAVFSREMVVGILSNVGLLSQPFGQMLAAAGTLVGLRFAYRRERRVALHNHAMSWLYLQR